METIRPLSWTAVGRSGVLRQAPQTVRSSTAAGICAPGRTESEKVLTLATEIDPCFGVTPHVTMRGAHDDETNGVRGDARARPRRRGVRRGRGNGPGFRCAYTVRLALSLESDLSPRAVELMRAEIDRIWQPS